MSTTVLLTAWFAAVAHGQPPPLGTVQRLAVISLDLQAAGYEKQTKRASYSPPPGWYIRGHSVICTHRQGSVSYLVSTVPAGWSLASEKRLADSSGQLFDLVARAHELGGQARFEYELDKKTYVKRTTDVSHHAIIVDVTATGGGMFHSASEIELTVVAELVYVGTETQRRGPVFGTPEPLGER